MSNVSAQLLHEETKNLQSWAAEKVQSLEWKDTKALVRSLGAYWQSDKAMFGFWLPEVNSEKIYLELYTPQEPLAFADEEVVRFRCERLAVDKQGDFIWAVVSGVVAGCREQFGTFYRLVYQRADGSWHYHYDPMAVSLPYGAFAPAELYDLERLDYERGDRDYFLSFGTSQEYDATRRGAPSNILQLHVPTASADGTLAGLARVYEMIAHKLNDHEPLSPADQTYLAYDAVQLMPVEPVIEFEGEKAFWTVAVADAANTVSAISQDPLPDTMVDIHLARPDMTNWGYDIVIAGSAAVNPTLLESGRPDELVDLISTLHNFPGKPIEVIFDVVYGHADNQALYLLEPPFFSGPNMYGQDLNYRHPVVRAMLLEMQRRKVNFGADGVRVDGAQDFKWWDAANQQLKHDDEYLLEMSAVTQNVANVHYQPWMIFEDGRPWPRADWETASTYLDVIEQQAHTFQWGPLTFAHNTPCLEDFWLSKWWRIKEIAAQGSHWISGCANHDTLRRGYQLPLDKPINQRLGATLPDILRRSYDNPAASLLTYGVFPGVPMEFINATTRAPWAFLRNTDKRYAVKVTAEEAGFLEWQLKDEGFHRDDAFPRLKGLGFYDLGTLRRFARTLERLVIEHDNDMLALLDALEEAEPSFEVDLSENFLKAYARAFMDDVHDYCNVSLHQGNLQADQCDFNMQVRNFRRQHTWLMNDLAAGEQLSKEERDGAVIFYAWRKSPDSGEQVLFIGNMEGEPITVTPIDLPFAELDADDWQVAITAPGVHASSLHEPVYLKDSEGVLFYRQLL